MTSLQLRLRQQHHQVLRPSEVDAMVTRIALLDDEHVTLLAVLLVVGAIEFVLQSLLKRIKSMFLQSAVKSAQVVVRLLFTFKLIDTILKVSLLPSAFIVPRHDPQFVKTKGWEPIEFESLDGVLLSGALFNIKQTSPKWVLFLHPNGVGFEQAIDYIKRYASRLGINAMTFNYRGVGRSKGCMVRASDLVLDGKGALRYLMENLQVDPSDIITHGWSLGGGVAPFLQLEWPDIGVINDRSFRSVQAVGEEIISGDPLLGGLMGSTAAMLFTVVTYGFERRSLQGAMAIGAILGAVGLLGPLAPFLLKNYQFDLDSVSAALATDPESRMLILYHRKDGMIVFNRTSFYKGLEASNALQDREEYWKTMELTLEHQDHLRNHMYSLTTNPNEWEAFENLTKEFLL